MFSKEQFIASIEWDTNVCKHLYTKMPEGALDYRPTENQRSTLELMQHLTACVRVPIIAILQNDFSNARELLEPTKSIPAEGFCNAMDQQIVDMKELLAPYSDEDMNTKEAILPMNYKTVLGNALVSFPLKFLASYKMQYFLYLKSCGATQLSTPNAWFGMDPPPK